MQSRREEGKKKREKRKKREREEEGERGEEEEEGVLVRFMHGFSIISMHCLLSFLIVYGLCMCFVLGVFSGAQNQFASGQEDVNLVRIFIILFWKCFRFYMV